ncbi:MAG: M3 family metallopeptidase [Patescibacteria group bacterium]
MEDFPIDPILDSMTVQGIGECCDRGLKRAKKLVDEIRSLASKTDQELTWDATFGAFDEVSRSLQEACFVPALLAVAHPDSAVRDAAMPCEAKVDAFVTQLYMDKDVFEVLKRYANGDRRSEIGDPSASDLRSPFSDLHSRFIEHTLRDYRRNGLDVPEEKQKRLSELNKELTKIGQNFERNLAETTLSISIQPDQLYGLPESYVASHSVGEDGMVAITTNYPDLIPFMTYANDRNAAMELYRLSQCRAAEQNLPLLDSLLKLRYEKAKLLGYETWADYVLEPRMAKNAKSVQAFLNDLHTALISKREMEFGTFKEEAKSLNLIQPDGSIRASDASYLEDRICKKQFALDTQELKNYFELNRVREGIFMIASELYGIAFTPSSMSVWHKDVQSHDVMDVSTGNLIGHLYMDLYPREGKFKHAAMFGLRNAAYSSDGSRIVPHAALVCNFPKPGDAPALLSHDEVTTFFHEFGHVLHKLLSESRLVSFAGTNCARDFVEVPSQMFEEWAWQREVLDRFAVHAETGMAIPDDLFAAMVTARTFGLATFTERQLFLAALDQTYHTSEPGIDTTKIVNTLHTQYSSFSRIPDTFFQATFGHLVNYDAAYYGYQWALSIAKDVLTRFESEGYMSDETAAEFRASILCKGGSQDEAEQAAAFLGRPTNAEAYKKFLGIN